MPDGGFKGMTPDPDSEKRGRKSGLLGAARAVPCESCGGMIYEGDWPWCGGNPRKHER